MAAVREELILVDKFTDINERNFQDFVGLGKPEY